MFEAKRQHPVAALTSSIKVVREHLLKILLIYLVGGQQSQSTFFSYTGILIVLGILLLWGILSWLRFTYRVDEGDLKIEYGVFVHKKLHIPRQRIQVIDISSGIVQRFFGLVSLKVQTAGQSSEETEISAVTRQEADRIQKLLRVDAKDDQTAEEEETVDGPVYHLSTNRLLTAAITSGSIGVALSIIGTVMSQINDLLAETQLYDFVLNYFKTVTGLIVTLTVVLLLAGILLAFLGTLIRYADFSITRQEDELIIRRGLFERKQMTIPLNRIQAIRLEEGILRQPFGLLSLQVDSAGYAGEEGTSTELFPLLRRSEVTGFIQDMLPEFNLQTKAFMPPGRSIRRFIIKLLIPAALLAAGFLYFLPVGYWILFGLFIVAGWGGLQYVDTALGVDREMLIMRSRRLSRSTVLIPKKRIQRFTIAQNWWQKRSEVADVLVTVASGKTGASFTVQHMDQNFSDMIFSWCEGDIDPVQVNADEFKQMQKSRLPDIT